jgi:hypothetical protein
MLRSAKRITVATLAMLSLLGAPVAAHAANQDQGDGLVNVQIGDIQILNDSPITVAAAVAASACDLVDVGSVAVLASQVDSTNRSQTVCKTETGPVRIRQN